MSIFFVFKQKTAYEMRISDWSSDVCSSDLMPHASGQPHCRCACRGSDGRGGTSAGGADTTCGRAGATDTGIVLGRIDLVRRAKYRGVRKSVVSGKSVSVRVDLGGRRIMKKKTNKAIVYNNKRT